MSKGNKIEINIGAKVKDSPIDKLKQKLKGVAQTSDSTEKKLGKMTNQVKTSPVEKLKNKLMSVPAVVTKLKDKFSQLKGKINNSFPVRASNFLKEKIKELRGETKKTGGAFDFLKGKIGGLIGIAAGILTLGTALSFVNSSIEDYKADMTNATKLKSNIQIVQAYKNDPVTMNKVFDEFQAEASRIQGIGVFGDEMMVGAQAQLSTFQLTNKEINMLMPKIADIVANQKGLNGTAEDFFGTANMIGKAMSTGMLAPLRKVGIALTDAEMKQFKTLNTTQRAAKLQEILSKNVGNVNEELAQTPLGKIQNAQNAWGDMKERIGEAAVMVKGRFAPYLVAAIPIVQELGTKIIDGIGKGIDYIQSNSGKIKENFKLLFGNIDFTAMLNGLKQFPKYLKEMFSGINFKELLGNAGTIINGLIKTIVEIFKFISPALKPTVQVFSFLIQQVIKFVAATMPIYSVVIKIAAVIGLIGGAILLLGNPITWIIGGFLALVTIVNNFGAISTAVINGFKGIVYAAVGAIAIYFQTQWNFISSAVNFAITAIIGYINLIISGVKNTLSLVVAVFTGDFGKAKDIAMKMIEDIKGFFTGLIDKAVELGNKIKSAFKVDVGGLIKGAGKFFGIGKNYNGTRSWRGGLTTVAEKGAEMIKIPNKQPFLAGQEMLMNLPQGTEISTAETTERELRKLSGMGNTTTTNNKSVSNTKNSENTNKKLIFSPKIVIYNNGDSDDIDNKVQSALNRFFEEKFISMGG